MGISVPIVLTMADMVAKHVDAPGAYSQSLSWGGSSSYGEWVGGLLGHREPLTVSYLAKCLVFLDTLFHLLNNIVCCCHWRMRTKKGLQHLL